MHINGATPRETNEDYNDGTLKLQLNIYSNTTVEKIGIHVIKPKIIKTIDLVNIREQQPKKKISKKIELL